MAFLVRLVQTYSVFKQIAKSICNKYSICFSSQKLPYSGASVFVLWGSSPFQRTKIAKQINICFAILVRWKGLEPPTYWFVASHSIQLSYQRVYVLHFLCFNTITQIKSKCNTFFIFCKDYLKYIFRVYHRRVLQVQGKGAFCNTLLCVFRQSVNPAPALKCQEVHGI